MRFSRGAAYAFLSGFLGLWSAAVHAQGIVLTTTGTYSQNFDSLPASGSAAWTNGSTLSGWYLERTGTSAWSAVSSVVSGSGSSTSGAVFSFGSGTSTDRALGSLGSNGWGTSAYGIEFRNSAVAGTSLTLGTLTYTGEQWRNGGNTSAQPLSLWYKVSSNDLIS